MVCFEKNGWFEFLSQLNVLRFCLHGKNMGLLLLRFYGVLSLCLRGHAVAAFLDMNVSNALGLEIPSVARM